MRTYKRVTLNLTVIFLTMDGSCEAAAGRPRVRATGVGAAGSGHGTGVVGAGVDVGDQPRTGRLPVQEVAGACA